MPISKKTKEKLKATEDGRKILDLYELHEKANKDGFGSRASVDFGRALDDNPDLWPRVFSISGSVKRALMQKVAGKSGDVEILQREYERYQERLGWAQATTLERLMIQRVLMSWLRVLHAEYYRQAIMNEENTFVLVKHVEDQLNSAHNRFVRSCEALAKLRKLQASIPESKKHTEPEPKKQAPALMAV